jgi:hypothetical protein
MNVERIQVNNDRFRAANESIRERADALGVDMQQLPFLCECPVEDCVDILRLTRAEYAAVRDHENRYMTAVGHEDREKPLGSVVARNGRYVTVVKSAA